jgi:spore maturation protein CgeD
LDADKLTILLTSYNRPNFIRRTLDSLLAQTNPNWRCIVLDDNSNRETLKVIQEYKDPRFELRKHKTTEEQREATVRYSVLINETLPELTDGVVGYLCDNVEYYPELVDTVLKWFDANPDCFMGYVLHRRDVWAMNGTAILGTALQYGHWDYTPPREIPITDPLGNLDHSQVFHRLPVDLRWTEDIQYVKFGDGNFFTGLVWHRHEPITPILLGKVLTLEHLVK